MKAIKIIAVLSMLALAACGERATNNRAASSPPTTAPSGNSFKLEDPIPPRPKPGVLDPKAISVDIDKDIRGQSAPEILDALYRLDIAKTTYESDAVYGKRMKELDGSQLTGEVAIGSVIGFAPEDIRFWYDANKQEWRYEISPSSVGNSFHYVPIYRQTLDVGGFPHFTRAFPGKRIEIKKVILLNIATMKGLSYINGFYKIAAKDAPTLENHLTVLLVGKITHPYADKSEKYPHQMDEHVVELQNAIGFKLDAVWLINKLDGKILSKIWAYKRLA